MRCASEVSVNPHGRVPGCHTLTAQRQSVPLRSHLALRVKVWHPDSRRCASSRAFTLLEVLAALLLVAVVLPVLMGAINTSTHLGGLASDRARAAVLAENRLNEIILDESWQFGDATGEFTTDIDGPDAARYLWELHVEQWLDPSVRKLTMTVHWERRGRPQTITLTTAVQDGGDA